MMSSAAACAESSLAHGVSNLWHTRLGIVVGKTWPPCMSPACTGITDSCCHACWCLQHPPPVSVGVGAAVWGQEVVVEVLDPVLPTQQQCISGANSCLGSLAQALDLVLPSCKSQYMMPSQSLMGLCVHCTGIRCFTASLAACCLHAGRPTASSQPPMAPSSPSAMRWCGADTVAHVGRTMLLM
jgi:hypothetical protein